MHMHSPSLNEFKKLAEEGNLIPVYREILADMDTPVSAFKKIEGTGYSFLFESVVGGEKWGRYSFLGARPSLIFKSKGRKIELIENGEHKVFEAKKDPLGSLKDLMSKYRPVKLPELPRFFGGAVGFLGYDMVRFFEDLPVNTIDDLDLPDSLFMVTDTIVIFDNISQKIKVVSNAYTEGTDLEDAYTQATAKVEEVITMLKNPLPRTQKIKPARRIKKLSPILTSRILSVLLKKPGIISGPVISFRLDRKSVVEGKSVDLGGRRISKKKKK